MNSEIIKNKLQELYEFATLHYPDWDSRPKRLNELLSEISDTQTTEGLPESLKNISGFLRGGMGSFTDIRLQASEASEFTDLELNRQLNSLADEVYELILDELNTS